MLTANFDRFDVCRFCRLSREIVRDFRVWESLAQPVRAFFRPPMTFFAAFVTACADERAYCASSPATPRAGLRPAGFFVAFFAILSLLVRPTQTFSGTESSTWSDGALAACRL